jgi:gliding motility-associated-like protein
MCSPNGDGINDVFEIIGLSKHNGYFSFTELCVYNRHGRKIWCNDVFDDISDFWSPNETNSPEGTYFYRFRAQGKTRVIEKTGVIEVLR